MTNNKHILRNKNIFLLIFNKILFKKFWSLFFFILIISIPCLGQSNSGKLAGKISDATLNQTLSSVSVIPKGSKKGTQSITDGTYILLLPAGKYTVSFSHSGYQQKDISDIEIKAGETTDLNIILEEANKKLQAVVVTLSVKKETVSAIYNKQKTSSAASDGISIETIRKTPDNNVGQIAKRITGVNVQDNRFIVVRGLADQYNQTTLNGVPMTSTESDRNAFALDLIPASVVDNIVVNKTATPDMPGNFAGGVVQINTKDFPSNDFFSIQLGAGFSDKTIGNDFYSDKRDKLEILSFGNNIRKLPKDFPSPSSKGGELRLYNNVERQRYLRMLKNNLAPLNHGPSNLNENIQLGYGKTFKFKNETQLGIVAALSQRKTELIDQEITARDPSIDQASSTTSDLIIYGLKYYSENSRYRYNTDIGGALNIAYSFGKNKITLKNLFTQLFDNIYTRRSIVRATDGAFPGLGKGYGNTYFPEQKALLNSVISGEHRTGKDNDTRIDWNVNITSVNTNRPDIRNFVLKEEDSVNHIYSINQNQNTVEQSLQQNSRIWQKDKDFIYGGAFNITSPFILFRVKQLLKGGMLFQNRARKAVSNTIAYSPFSSTIDSFLAPSHFYGANGASLGTFDGASTGNYNAGSSSLAAYISIENKIWEKIRFIWGIRAENYQQYVYVYSPLIYNNFRDYDFSINALSARNTFDFLPSANLVYALTKKINIRAAYSKTVIRPELKDLADFERYDYQKFIVILGNSNLRSTNIQNFDLKFELFPSAGEIVSLAAFYKKIVDPIEFARSLNYFDRSIRSLNTGDAYVKGLEAEVRKKIDFIPFAPWLKNVTLFANGSLLESKVNSIDINTVEFQTVAEHTLTGQPDYIINAGISISAFKNTFETTLNYNRTGDYIYQLGSAAKVEKQSYLPTPVARLLARDLLDLVITQSLFKNKCKIKLSASNLLNKPYIIYQDTNGNKKFDAPIKVKPFSVISEIDAAYESGIDALYLSVQPQRTYSFSISYTF